LELSNIGLGFPFLTIGIISGGVWANEGKYILELGSKRNFALITWLVFATYLHAWITKVEGKRTAILVA
jgi:ABC-type transport system involved in cytochrome c biogenesis permease subunit